jgi:hypothetical protein
MGPFTTLAELELQNVSDGDIGTTAFVIEDATLYRSVRRGHGFSCWQAVNGVFTDELLPMAISTAQQNTSTPFAPHWYFESTDGLPSYHQVAASGVLCVPFVPNLYPAGTVITGYRAKVDPAATEVMAIRLCEDDPGPAATVGTPAGTVKATVDSDGTANAQVVTKSSISVVFSAAKNYVIEVVGSAGGAGSIVGSLRVSGIRPLRSN